MNGPTDGEPYTRAELEAVGDEPPARGPLCPHCNQRIPEFAELCERDRRRVMQLISELRWIAANMELRAATGCPYAWAKVWVEHGGRPKPDWNQVTPCPYCGEPLRSSLAKQCRHCRRDWHDPDHLRWLGEPDP